MVQKRAVSVRARVWLRAVPCSTTFFAAQAFQRRLAPRWWRGVVAHSCTETVQCAGTHGDGRYSVAMPSAVSMYQSFRGSVSGPIDFSSRSSTALWHVLYRRSAETSGLVPLALGFEPHRPAAAQLTLTGAATSCCSLELVASLRKRPAPLRPRAAEALLPIEQSRPFPLKRTATRGRHPCPQEAAADSP
jgi:hypothetical protein